MYINIIVVTRVIIITDSINTTNGHILTFSPSTKSERDAPVAGTPRQPTNTYT